jgi:hypothetical protein
MSSPFSTFKEFSEAKGPIYTFSHNPTVGGIFLGLSLVITIYFFYASYTMKQEDKPATNLAALGLLIVTGVTSLFSSLLHPAPAKQDEAARYRHAPVASAKTDKTWQPFVALGMMSIGSVMGRPQRRSLHRSKLKRR